MGTRHVAGRGRLFRNARKRHPRHPDYTGTLTLEGRTFNLAGWEQTALTTGDRFVSFEAIERAAPVEDPRAGR